MKNYIILWVCLTLSFFVSCSAGRTEQAPSLQTIEERLRGYAQRHAEAETSDDLENFLSFYNDSAISMPEYQLTLQGRTRIKSFYREIFARQKVKTFQRDSHEFIHMDGTIIEIGTFRKQYSELNNDSLVTLNGKYWHVWETQHDGDFKLKGEAYGYFHQVSNPVALVVSIDDGQPDESALIKSKIPFELRAYNALMEKGVRNRDALLRSEFFTDDGSFYPFADTTVTGMNNIKPYLIAYSSGNVTIDSIMCYTYDYEIHRDYIIEYDMFKVTWTLTPTTSGRTEGKGIRIWKRQADHSLKLYREIGTHNHLK